MSDQKPTAFEQAGRAGQGSLLGEIALFLRQNKKYWLIPLVLVLLLLGALIVLGGTAAAPFIYTLF